VRAASAGVGTVSPADRLPFEARPDLPYPRISNYRWKGLSLCRHPLAFLRADLTERRMVPCAELRRARDGRRVRAAGLVLVRQKPGAAKGVMFIVAASAAAAGDPVGRDVACRGRVQHKGEVVHLPST
jgi:error-prone DNA polymerase